MPESTQVDVSAPVAAAPVVAAPGVTAPDVTVSTADAVAAPDVTAVTESPAAVAESAVDDAAPVIASDAGAVPSDAAEPATAAVTASVSAEPTTTAATATETTPPTITSPAAAAATDPTMHCCYICAYEEPKAQYTNKTLTLTGDVVDGKPTKFKPELHYTRRRFKKCGRELQFLDDSEWVWPWTKGVTTEYSVQFVTFEDPKDASAGERMVCGSCIREKHADLWKKITDYNHNYI